MEKTITEKASTAGKETEIDPNEEVVLAPFRYVCQVPGKRVREKLSIAFNHWLNIPQEKMAVIGEVVQMLHDSSMLIDDIQDDSTKRRGNPVTHRVYGMGSTINSANYVYFLALQKLFALGDVEGTSRVFTEHLLECHRGQGMDIYWRQGSICPSEDQYILMVKQKTGGLFSLVACLMQLFSKDKRDFRPFCVKLGVYFQIRDDYADLMSEEYHANKIYCEDITEGKLSFPIMHAVRERPNDYQVMNILRQRTEDLDVKRYCVGYMKRVGSFKYTEKYLRQLEKELLDEIAEIGENHYMEAIVHHLSKVYKEEEGNSSKQ